MVIVDCPWCLGPVALNDDDTMLACDACSIHVELDREEVPAIAAIAA